MEQREQDLHRMTVHAGLLLRHVPLTAERMTGIVSRGSPVQANWCLVHHDENFLYTHFDDMGEIFAQYDVVLSMSDGLRLSSTAVADEAALYAELGTLAA